jgi:hypothetical protein
MSKFDVAAYNQLLLIHEADNRFNDQLASAGITRPELFSQLAPILLEGEHAGKYAICLLHRHYSLNKGERMVTNDLVTKPSTNTSPRVVAERWSCTGQEIEYRLINDPASLPPPPSSELLSKVKSILDAKGIDILGVCYAPEKLADGFEFMEVSGPGDRVQILSIVHVSTVDPYESYQAVWIAAVDPSDNTHVLRCGTNCGKGVNGAPHKLPKFPNPTDDK